MHYLSPRFESDRGGGGEEARARALFLPYSRFFGSERWTLVQVPPPLAVAGIVKSPEKVSQVSPEKYCSTGVFKHGWRIQLVGGDVPSGPKTSH